MKIKPFKQFFKNLIKKTAPSLWEIGEMIFIMGALFLTVGSVLTLAQSIN